MESYEVIIVGGGMVGLSLAVALADAGVRVAVIDREPVETQKSASFDGRVSAVALSSRRMLERLGAWERMKPHAEPILDIRVSDGNSPFFLHYGHDEVGVERFGYIVENRVIRDALLEKAATCDHLSFLAPAAVESLACAANEARVTLSNGRKLKAALVIGADGKRSHIRGAAGIPAMEQRYGQTAIVTTIRHEKPHHGLAQERFFPTGPFAVLPMTGNRSSLVWVEPEKVAPAYLALSDEEMLSEIETRVGTYLGKISLCGPRFAYPLEVMHATRYASQRVALVGDAAHAIHPVAGQGVNLGWRDAAVLAELVVDAKRLGLDIGAAMLLERYQRWRRFDNVTMLAVTDGLNRLFTNRSDLLRLARGLGFAAVSHLPPVKHFFMRHAMGLVGDLPRLLQGRAL